MRRLVTALALLTVVATWAPANEQAKYPPLPEAFSSFGAAVADGYVYVYGGHISKTHSYSTEAVTNKFRRLNLAKPASGWEELPGQTGLQGLALVAHRGKLIRIGGMQPRNPPGEKADNISVASCAIYDPGTKKWDALPDLPAGRSSHDAILVGDKLVVVGGWHMKGRGNETAWHDTTLVLDLSKTPLKWESVPQPFKRRALNIAAIGAKVYVVGGMNGDEEIEKTVNVLDVATQRWASIPEIPGERRNGFAPAACNLGDRLFVSPADGKVYRLSVKQDAWEEVGSLAKARIVHRLVPAGPDMLLALGGAAKGDNVAESETVQPKPASAP